MLARAPLSIDISNAITYIIYTYFSLIKDDLRHQRTWLYWFQIFSDVEKYGYHAAAALNAAQALKCKLCSKPRKEIFVKMKGVIQEDGSIKYICPKCGSDEQLTARVSTKHLRNIYAKASEKANDAVIALSEFKEIKEIHKSFVDNNKEVFLKCFKEYEAVAIKDLLSAREHYFIGHYDPNKKSKRRWCSLSNNVIHAIEIDDPNYKKLIKDLLDSYEIHDDIAGEGLISKLHQKLVELNYPNEMIFQKIGIDIELAHILHPTSGISPNS